MVLLLNSGAPPSNAAPSLLPCAPVHDPFFCPTKWQLFEQVCAILRPGRATQTNIDTVEIAAGEAEAWPPDNPWGAALTVLQQYWASFSEVLEHLHQRACALVPEFFCSTVNETRPEWHTEYAYPDPCEAYDTLCEKVNAIGGARCAYFVALAARRGWSVTCLDCAGLTETSGADCSAADCAHITCSDDCDASTMIISIDTASSPAFVAPELSSGADCAAADCSDLCEPNIESLKCLIERVKPAHVKAIYLVN